MSAFSSKPYAAWQIFIKFILRIQSWLNVPLKTNLSCSVPWASSRPSRGSLLLSLGSEPFLVEPKDVHAAPAPGPSRSPAAPVTQPWLGALIPHACRFSPWVFSPAVSFFFRLSSPIRLQQTPPSLSPPVSAQGSLTASVRGSGHT